MTVDVTPQPAAPAAPETAAPVIPAPAPAAPDNAPAPAPEPVAPLSITPPAPAPAPAVEIVVYDPTGDAGLDLALDFVGKRGFGPETPEIVAATKGDFGPLEAALKARGDDATGFEKIIEVAKASYARNAETAKTKAAAATALVHQTVGGEARWNEIQKFAAANAEPAERDAINAMLNAGGIQAQAAAMFLSQAFASKGGSVAPGAVVSPAATTHAPTVQPLSPRDFATESQKLYAKFGNRFDQTPEYREIVARRKSYRG